MPTSTDWTLWCEKHEGFISPWIFEDETRKWLCSNCYDEYWKARDEEIWGEDA
jgi:hypothetical protein